jgi:hypothetical protein
VGVLIELFSFPSIRDGRDGLLATYLGIL